MPLYKGKGSKYDVNNYRLVCLLSVLSKNKPTVRVHGLEWVVVSHAKCILERNEHSDTAGRMDEKSGQKRAKHADVNRSIKHL